MKMTQRKYIASEMGVTANPEAIVTVRFKIGQTYHGRLGDLGEWVKATGKPGEGGVDWIQECTSDGLSHGVYIAFYATSEPMRAALSILRGVQVDLFDGICFRNVTDATNALAALRKASIPIPSGTAKWVVTNLPHPNQPTKAAPKVDVPDPLQRELEEMGSPF